MQCVGINLLEDFLALASCLGVRTVAVLAELRALFCCLLMARAIALSDGFRCVD